MALMMVSCGADKGTDVAQNTKSKATNSKNTSSVVSSEAVTADVASSEAASSVAVSNEAPVSSKTPTVSKDPVAGKEPVASTAPAVSSSAPVNTGNTNGWVCPDQSAHGDVGTLCNSAEKHQQMIKEYEETNSYLQWLKENPPALDPTKYCNRCGRPWGDGYNGTCKGYFCNGDWRCHHYDTGDTCQIPH